MPTINVNGKTITVPNGSMSIVNGRVYINGKPYGADGADEAKEINITIQGDVESLHVEQGNVTVEGNVTGSVKTQAGDVHCSGNVGGDVKIQAGNVNCGPVGGNVRTLAGNIHHS